MMEHEFMKETRTFWNKKVSKIYSYIEEITYIFINQVKSSMVIDLINDEIRSDISSRSCIVCFGGSAYESYKKIFELDKNLNIDFPETIDYDISISLKDSINTKDESKIKEDIEEIIKMTFEEEDLNNKRISLCENKEDYKKYNRENKEKGELICIINKKYIITRYENWKYMSYRILIVIETKLFHIIEIFLRKYNYVNEYMTFNDVKDFKLVKIIDNDNNIHLTINCNTLIKTNLLSLKDRIKDGYYIKAWKDYNRISKLLELINMNKSNIKIIRNVCKWLNDNNFHYYKKTLNKYPYILIDKYIIKTKINKKLESIMEIVLDNDIKKKIELLVYYNFTNNNEHKKIIDEHLIFVYKENHIKK